MTGWKEKMHWVRASCTRWHPSFMKHIPKSDERIFFWGSSHLNWKFYDGDTSSLNLWPPLDDLNEYNIANWWMSCLLTHTNHLNRGKRRLNCFLPKKLDPLYNGSVCRLLKPWSLQNHFPSWDIKLGQNPWCFTLSGKLYLEDNLSYGVLLSCWQGPFLSTASLVLFMSGQHLSPQPNWKQALWTPARLHPWSRSLKAKYQQES